MMKVFHIARRKFTIAVLIAAAVLVLGVGTALATHKETQPPECHFVGFDPGPPAIESYECGNPIASSYFGGADLICFKWDVTTPRHYPYSVREGSCFVGPVDPALWLADVCEPYYGGMYDQYGQMTFGTDYGTELYVGASSGGPWTRVHANGPAWVLTMSDLDALAASLGVADTGDLWFTSRTSNAYAKARLLSSMVAERAANWDDDCAPVEGGPATSAP